MPLSIYRNIDNIVVTNPQQTDSTRNRAVSLIITQDADWRCASQPLPPPGPKRIGVGNDGDIPRTLRELGRGDESGDEP